MEDLHERYFSMKKVDELVRMGLMPVEQLPWLMQALRHMQQDAYLPYMERKILYDFVQRVFSQVFNDPLMYRLIRQRAAMNKYEDFDPTIEEAAPIKSGPDLKKTPEGMLATYATSAERKQQAGGKVSPEEKKLASRAKTELRRRRDVANKTRKESYQAAFDEAMKAYDITSMGELSEEDIKDFLNTVEQIFNSNSGE